MRRSWSLALLFCLVILCAHSAHAVIGKADSVPGATLLYPYFEVDMGNANGATTLIAVQNASATAILAHFTLWTDLGVPTLYFNVYLTGYDVQSINIGDIFRLGNLPRSASAGQDPTDQVSPKGNFSQDINFASCSGQLPYQQTGALLPGTVADLVRLHQGLSSSLYYPGLCAATLKGDGFVRGYITVDTVNNCTQRRPNDPGYFSSGGTGDATNQNVMQGDYFQVNPSTNFIHVANAVAIEASGTAVASGETFYGRLSNVNGTAIDNREPLPTAWAAPLQGGRSDLVFWREPEVNVAAFSCASSPPFYSGTGLQQNQIVLFDGEENGVDSSSSVAFRSLAGRFTWQSLSAKSGWLFLNLNTTVAAERFPQKQSWVTVRSRPEQTTADTPLFTGFPAIQLGDAFTADNPILVPNP